MQLTTAETIEICDVLDRAADIARTAPAPESEGDRERLIDSAVANVDATISLIARTRRADRPRLADRWEDKARREFEPDRDPEDPPDDDEVSR